MFLFLGVLAVLLGAGMVVHYNYLKKAIPDLTVEITSMNMETTKTTVEDYKGKGRIYRMEEILEKSKDYYRHAGKVVPGKQGKRQEDMSTRIKRFHTSLNPEARRSLRPRETSPALQNTSPDRQNVSRTQKCESRSTNVSPNPAECESRPQAAAAPQPVEREEAPVRRFIPEFQAAADSFREGLLYFQKRGKQQGRIKVSAIAGPPGKLQADEIQRRPQIRRSREELALYTHSAMKDCGM